MTKPNVLIFAPRDEPASMLAEVEKAGIQVSFGNRDWPWTRKPEYEDELIAAARESVGMMGSMIRCTPITRRVMESCQRLRIVAKYTVGVDDVDIDAATELGIMVCHGPTEANCYGVAETTMTFILAMLKKVQERDEAVRQGRWREPVLATTFLGARVSENTSGITIGLVGMGRIAMRVSQLLAPWRVRIISYDPYAHPSSFQLSNATRVDYETLLRESDVISYHVTLTNETRWMMDEKELALCKKGATIINTARGKVIRESALAKAIESGHISGAALDVFEEEPLPMDSPLRQLGTKVLLSPHSASFNRDGELRPGMAWAMRSIVTALKGGVPDNVYNKEVIPRWRERFGGASVVD